MCPEQITWVSTIDAARYNWAYRYAIDSWHLLPGRRILFLDGEATVRPEIETQDFWLTVDRDKSHWLQQPRPKKAHRFWFKGHTIYHALKQKFTRYVVWIDADVLVTKSMPAGMITTDGYAFAMMEFKHSLFPEGHSWGRAIESGFQIFDTEHYQIDAIAEEYYAFWETGKIFELFRPYDSWVSTAVSKQHSFLNLVKYNNEKRFIGENTFLYTDFADYMIHFLGKGNKEQIKNYVHETNSNLRGL